MERVEHHAARLPTSYPKEALIDICTALARDFETFPSNT